MKHMLRVRRRISVTLNTVQTKFNEMTHLIIYSLNCSRREIVGDQ